MMARIRYWCIIIQILCIMTVAFYRGSLDIVAFSLLAMVCFVLNNWMGGERMIKYKMFDMRVCQEFVPENFVDAEYPVEIRDGDEFQVNHNGTLIFAKCIALDVTPERAVICWDVY